MDRADWAFVVAERRVLHEEIDGEILAIDNETGTYLSLQGFGAELWTALASGVSSRDLCEAVATTYAVEIDVATPAVEGFVTQLAETGVLEPIDPSASVRPELAPPERAGTVPEPVVEVYTDLQHLLLFDPIHEVDEAGWPNVKT